MARLLMAMHDSADGCLMALFMTLLMATNAACLPAPDTAHGDRPCPVADPCGGGGGAGQPRVTPPPPPPRTRARIPRVRAEADDAADGWKPHGRACHCPAVRAEASDPPRQGDGRRGTENGVIEEDHGGVGGHGAGHEGAQVVVLQHAVHHLPHHVSITSRHGSSPRHRVRTCPGSRPCYAGHVPASGLPCDSRAGPYPGGHTSHTGLNAPLTGPQHGAMPSRRGPPSAARAPPVASGAGPGVTVAAAESST